MGNINFRKLKRRFKLKKDEFFFHVKNRDAESNLVHILQEHRQVSPIILFLSGLSWNKQLTQRPHHLAQALAHQGALVFYLEPEIQLNQPAFTKLEENFYWCNAPVTSFRYIHSAWVYMLSWSLDYTRCMDKPRIIYDIVDDLLAFQADKKEIQLNHVNRLRQAKLVLVSAHELLPLTDGFSDKTILCPNAVDFDFFNKPHSFEYNASLFSKQIDRPIIGYSGAIAQWIDFDLLRQVVETCPRYHFVFVGPDMNMSLINSGLLKMTNVHWLGQQSYEKLPNILAYFDVGIIPFKLNPITHATSPLKLFEYFAAGKPVVITAMHECMRYPGVHIAHNSQEFISQLELALQKINDQDYLNLIVDIARHNTWKERAIQILELLSNPQLAS